MKITIKTELWDGNKSKITNENLVKNTAIFNEEEKLTIIFDVVDGTKFIGACSSSVRSSYKKEFIFKMEEGEKSFLTIVALEPESKEERIVLGRNWVAKHLEKENQWKAIFKPEFLGFLSE